MACREDASFYESLPRINQVLFWWSRLLLFPSPMYRKTTSNSTFQRSPPTPAVCDMMGQTAWFAFLFTNITILKWWVFPALVLLSLPLRFDCFGNAHIAVMMMVCEQKAKLALFVPLSGLRAAVWSCPDLRVGFMVLAGCPALVCSCCIVFVRH